jgi:tRNA (cmo5U34)-methyltransferase
MIGVDREKDMIRVANEKYKHTGVHFLAADIANIDLKKSDMIVCYYTLQFIKPKERQLILDKCYEALHWGGALVVFDSSRKNQLYECGAQRFCLFEARLEWFRGG